MIKFHYLLFLILITNSITHAQEGDENKEATKTDITCSNTVNFQWERVNTDPKQKNEILKVFFKSVTSTATTKEEAEKIISTTIQETILEAQEHCKIEHEQVQACFTKGFRSLQREYRISDYQIRKAMLDSIHQQCSLNQGKCLTAIADETVCK